MFPAPFSISKNTFPSTIPSRQSKKNPRGQTSAGLFVRIEFFSDTRHRIPDNPFCLRKLILSVCFCKRIGRKRCLPFVPERVNEIPVAARNVNKGGQFSVVTTGSPCIGNLIAKRPSALCPFGEDIQVIAAHITFVSFLQFPLVVIISQFS